MSVFGVILVRFLPHSYSVRIWKNTDQNNIRKLGEITVFYRIRIQSEYEKVRARITLNTDTFHPVYMGDIYDLSKLSLPLNPKYKLRFELRFRFCVKYRNFALFPGLEMLWKSKDSDSPETLRKLRLSTKFLHQEIR